MKAVLKLEGLCCANCAARIENDVKKIDGVEDAAVSVITQKMTINAPDSEIERIVQEATGIARRIDGDVEVVRVK